MQMRAVDVDFDVHRVIENERLGFDDPPNAALRRLLGLPEVGQPKLVSEKAESATGRAWEGEGVKLPHSTKLRFIYSGRSYEGEIIDGFWLVDGEQETSPSGAASAVALTKANKKTRLDGWKYWQVKRPGDADWTQLSGLRPSQSTNLTLEQLGI